MPDNAAVVGVDGDADVPRDAATVEQSWGSAVRILGVALLVAALFAVVFTRLELARTKPYLEHDEALSVLAATGHDVAFSVDRPKLLNRWVPVSTFQSYLQIDRPFDFASVEKGLAATDVAPPLYFWLLHLWLLVLGSSTTSAMLFNIPIAMGTALAITGLVRKATGNFTLGAAAALGWALTLPAWTLSNMARPYDQLALFSVLITWQVLRFLDEDASRVQDTVVLGLLFAAGMLTQYYFALTAVAVVLVVLYAAFRGRRLYLVGRLAAAVGGAVVVFFLLNPHWYQAVLNGQKRFPAERTAAAMTQRVGLVIRTLFSASGIDRQAKLWALSIREFMPGFQIRYAAAFVAVALVAILALAIMRGARFSRISFGAGAAIFVALWTSGVTLLLYLGFVSPPWAMGDRYMAAAWALGAAAVALGLSALPKRLFSVGVATWLALMLVGTFQPVVSLRAKSSPAIRGVSGAERVVLDSEPRGYVLRYLLDLPSTAEMYVASQPELVASPTPWLPLMRPGDLYVHIPGGSGPNPPPIGGVLAGRFDLEKIPGGTVKRFALPSEVETDSSQ